MRYLAFFFSLGALFTGFYFLGSRNPVPVVPGETHVATYPNKDFYLGLEQPDYEQRMAEKIYGGIISHHLLTAEDMAQLFAELTDQNISTVVLIGPNHFTIGESKLAISRQPYETPWGLVQPSLETIDALLASGVVTNEEEPFVYEHAIAAVVPFMAHYLPEARLVPIVLQSSTNPVELDSLVAELVQTLPEDSLVLASVDFSHHLNRLGADFHDRASFSAIRSFDLERIFNLEIDSPPSIYTVLSYLQGRGAQRMSLLQKNSTSYTGSLSSEDVTSYFFAHFTKGAVDPVSIATTLHFGDMMFDRQIKERMQDGYDPFEYIKGVEGNFLRGVDAIIANLEGPITETTDCAKNDVVFTFSPKITRQLSQYLTGVNLANNHSTDCGTVGIEDTKRFLHDADISYFGDTVAPHSVVVGDLRVAVIGTKEIGRRVEDFSIEQDEIKALKLTHDQVIVHIHWGYEYATEPSEQQQAIAHMLVEAGADVIIGHHPHVIQPVERYRDSLIFYSLGNFIFDQTMPGTQEGIGVGLVHEDKKLGAYIFPYTIQELQPRLLDYEASEEFCTKFLAAVATDVRDTCYVQINF